MDASEVPSSDAIRKSKRRIELQFDLSEGDSAEINGYSILRSDFLRATDELADEQKREFYFELHKRHRKLNRFLVEGELDFFQDYQHESLFDHRPFLEFISPHFAHQYNKSLKSALRNKNLPRIWLLTSHDPLVTEEHKSGLYRGAKQYVRHIREDIESTLKKVKKGNSPSLGGKVKALEAVDADLLNALPDDLESERSQIASTLRDLSVNTFNELDDAGLARDFLLKAKELEVGPVTESRLEESLEQIEEIYERRQLADRYNDELEECADAVSRLAELAEGAERSTANPKRIRKEARDVVDTDTLNNLPDDFGEVRSQVALGLRNLATILWNNHQSGEIAISLTKLALVLQVEPSLKSQLREDLELLEELTEEKKQAELEQIRQISSQISDLRNKIESVGGPLSRETVDWHAVRRFIRATFTDEVISFLEDADESPERRKLFNNISSILTEMPSSNRVSDRLISLVGATSSNASSSTSSQESSSSAGSQSSKSGASKTSSNKNGDKKYNKGCIFAVIFVIIIIILNS